MYGFIIILFLFDFLYNIYPIKYIDNNIGIPILNFEYF